MAMVYGRASRRTASLWVHPSTAPHRTCTSEPRCSPTSTRAASGIDPFDVERAFLGDEMRFGHDDHAFARGEPKLASSRRKKRKCERQAPPRGTDDHARQVQRSVARLRGVLSSLWASASREDAMTRRARPIVRNSDESAANTDHVHSDAIPRIALSSVGLDSTSAVAPPLALRRATSARTESSADSASQSSGRKSNASSRAAAARPRSPGLSTPARTRPR